MRVLLPPAEGGDVEADVHAFYAAGWLDRGGLRVNFVVSADGAAHADGRSEGLQTPGDNRIFAALRDLADVVLVGGGTVQAEGYRAINLSARRRGVRHDHGLREVLPTAVVSRTLRLDPASGLFTGTRPEARTVVLTCAAAPADRRAALEQVADVVLCGDEAVEPGRARTALEDRGLTRILSEGGPTTWTEFAAAGVVDELCLSLSPLLVGPGAPRITAGPRPWVAAQQLSLTGLLEEDGALFLRYRTA